MEVLNPVKVDWVRDEKSHRLFWEELDRKVLRFLELAPKPAVLDVGGSDGRLTRPLADLGGRVVVLDIDPAALKLVSTAANPVLADIRRLPFKDGAFDGVAARAAMHHVPEDFYLAVGEVNRVLREGGLFLLQEPLASNPLYAMARGLVTTTWHAEDERPLRWEEYQSAIRTYYQPLEVSPHFLITYLVPFIIPLLKTSTLPGEKTLLRMDYLDRRLLQALPGVARYAAYIHLLARKRGNRADQEQVPAPSP